VARAKSPTENVIFGAVFDPFGVYRLFLGLPFTISPGDAAPLAAHSQTHGAQTLASDAYIAYFPSSLGLGTLQVFNGELTIFGTIDSGIFPAMTLNFDGTKVAAKKAKAASLKTAPSTPSTLTTLAVRQTLKRNPALGTFKGHMTRAKDGTEFKTTAVVADNKNGHPAIDFQLVDTGFGTIEIQSVIHPTHTGSFTLDLGSGPADGVLMGHITHTGRLVLHLNVRGTSDLVGTQTHH
jgi:hypothetical protein